MLEPSSTWSRRKALVLFTLLSICVGWPTDGESARKTVACNEVVSGAVVLDRNLQCDHPVTIRSGTLKLNGWTLGSASGPVVRCEGTCRIIGPGSVVASAGMAVDSRGSVTLVRVTVSGSARIGVAGEKVVIRDSAVRGFWSAGVAAERLYLVRSTIDGHGCLGADVSTAGITGAVRLGWHAARATVRRSFVSGQPIDGACRSLGACDQLAGVRERVPRGPTKTQLDSAATSGVTRKTS